jgi:hypothetical protein
MDQTRVTALGQLDLKESTATLIAMLVPNTHALARNQFAQIFLSLLLTVPMAALALARLEPFSPHPAVATVSMSMPVKTTLVQTLMPIVWILSLLHRTHLKDDHASAKLAMKETV